MEIAKARARWRKSIKSEGAYSKAEYRRRIAVHADTLRKYLGQFGRWLAIWVTREDNLRLAESAFGRDRLEEVLAGAEPSIYEVYTLFTAKDLSREFGQYLLGKTHLSFDLGKEPTPKDQPRFSQSGPYYSKLAEFVHIILAEYVVLHNYMFVSGLRAKEVRSIDRWLRPISRNAPGTTPAESGPLARRGKAGRLPREGKSTGRASLRRR